MKNNLDSEMIELVVDISEAGIDQLIKDPLLKDIPLLGTVVNIARIGKTISDRIFLSKVITFLASIRNDNIVWNDFSNQLRSDESFKNKTQETVILLIDRSDNLEKVRILAKVFQKLIEQKITFEEFHRIGFAIDLAFINDLQEFIRLESTLIEVDDSRLLLSLVPTGLTEMLNKVRNTYGQYHTNPIRITHTGMSLIKIMNERN